MPTTELHPLVTFLLAYVIASITSLGGLSGAFLLLPFQVSVLGASGPVATATNHLYNIIATPTGAVRYAREGRLLWPLVAVIVVGTLPGVIIGTWIRIHWLSDPKLFALFLGAVLLLIGSRLIQRLRRSSPMPQPGNTFRPKTTRFDWRRLEYEFCGVAHSLPVPLVALLTLAVGVIGGAYGIGGGAIIAPILVSLWGLPVHTIAGASLCGTFLTSTVAVLCFSMSGNAGSVGSLAPDWALGLTLGLGGLFGTYTGARLQRFVPARPIEILLALVTTGLGLAYIVGFLVRT